MKLTKILAAALAAAMCLSFAACGGEESSSTASTESSVGESSVEESHNPAEFFANPQNPRAREFLSKVL